MSSTCENAAPRASQVLPAHRTAGGCLFPVPRTLPWTGLQRPPRSTSRHNGVVCLTASPSGTPQANALSMVPRRPVKVSPAPVSPAGRESCTCFNPFLTKQLITRGSDSAGLTHLTPNSCSVRTHQSTCQRVCHPPRQRMPFLLNGSNVLSNVQSNLWIPSPLPGHILTLCGDV